MPVSYLEVIAPIIGLIINVSVQVFGFRYFPAIGLLKSLLLGFICGLSTVIILECYVLSGIPKSSLDFISIFFTNVIAYSALGYCYFNFLNLGETARRIRIVRELHESGGLSMEDILKKYNVTEIVHRRINRLINNGQIIERDGKYYIGSPVMLTIARVIAAMKLILLGKKSEFE